MKNKNASNAVVFKMQNGVFVFYLESEITARDLHAAHVRAQEKRPRCGV